MIYGRFFLVMTSMMLMSCASYVQKMHQRISYEERHQAKKNGHGWPYPKKNSPANDRRPIVEPLTYTSPQENSNPASFQTPKRSVASRHSAEDFIDNDSAGSLWGNYQGIKAAHNKQINLQMGEIIVINVLQSFKEDISRELRRAHPAPSRAPASPGSASSRRTGVNPAAPAGAGSSNTAQSNADSEEAVIVYDKIPSRVSQQLGDRHIILKGNKEVFFRNDKMLVEVEAMVLKDHINDDGSLLSDHIIESRVRVMR